VNGSIAALIAAVGTTPAASSTTGCGVAVPAPAVRDLRAGGRAVDYSRRCVEQARAAHGPLLNVEVQTTGWLARRSAGEGVDAVLMANVPAASAPAVRARILDLALRRLRPGGVPAAGAARGGIGAPVRGQPPSPHRQADSAYSRPARGAFEPPA